MQSQPAHSNGLLWAAHNGNRRGSKSLKHKGKFTKSRLPTVSPIHKESWHKDHNEE